MLTQLNIIKSIVFVSLITAVNYVALQGIDELMASYIVGYQTRSTYLLTTIMNFIACLITIVCGLKFGWARMLPFIYIGMAVFFPLIFLNSAWEVNHVMDAVVRADYQAIFCSELAQESSYEFLNTPLCGEALAYIIFSRVISALPLLFLTPGLFYLVFTAGYFDADFTIKNFLK